MNTKKKITIVSHFKLTFVLLRRQQTSRWLDIFAILFISSPLIQTVTSPKGEDFKTKRFLPHFLSLLVFSSANEECQPIFLTCSMLLPTEGEHCPQK